MRIAEPMTTLTDVLLGVLALWMGASLASRAAAGAGEDAWLWSLGFLATACAAFLGAAAHGLVHHMGEPMHQRVWLATLLAIGVADVGLGGGAVLGLAPRLLALALLIALVAKFGVFVLMVVRHPLFKVAAYDYAATMALLLALAVLGLVGGVPGSGHLALGLALGFVGAGIQQSGWKLHQHLNHNDLYHIVQMVALWLVYQGALRLVA